MIKLGINWLESAIPISMVKLAYVDFAQIGQLRLLQKLVRGK